MLTIAAVALVLHKPKRTLPPASLARPTEAPASAPAIAIQARHYPETASASDQRRWLVDQLRALGMPDPILAKIVLMSLDKAWTRHATEVTLKYHGDPDVMARLQLETDKSKDAEMRAALGDDAFKQWDEANMQREVSQGRIQLTVSESDQAYDLWKNLKQRQLALEQADVDGTMDPADINDAMEKAASEFNQQMKNALGDERYAKSQQTGDGTEGLRPDLANASPSDSQFQKLLNTQLQWNQQRSALDKQFQSNPSSPDYAEQIKSLDAAREQEYRRVLGDTVFDTLQKSQNPGYTQMKNYESLWGLDDRSIDSVYGEMKYYQKSMQDYEDRARALEAQGQNVDWDGVQKNLQQFAQQTQQALQSYLGQDRFNRMARNGVFQLGLPELTGHSTPDQ